MKSETKHGFSVSINDEKAEEKLAEIMASKITLADYENSSFKSILPQCIGTFVSSAFNLIVGLSLAYSGILIPAIESPTSDIETTKTESSLIASITTLVIALTSLICGPVMDRIGRLNSIKIAVVPMALGWGLIALANNTTILLLGRFFVGISGALGVNSVPVYISEISRPDLRGALTSVLTLTSSTGMELVYLLSTLMDWRTIAWTALVMSFIPIFLLYTIHESPVWLMSKGKEKEAKKCLQWLHKYHKQHPEEQDIVEVHFSILKKEQTIMKDLEMETERGNILLDFLKPTGYKPTIILIGLFIIQQFSGAYVIIFNAVIFFEGVGSSVDPILASNLITGSTVLMSILNVFSLKIFNKKPLMLFSCVGMGICMYISALYTKWIHEGRFIKKNKVMDELNYPLRKVIGLTIFSSMGTTEHKWVPLAFLFAYMVLGMMGLMPVPWTMMAECFPLHLRGIATSTIASLAAGIMFLAVQSFRTLNDFLGGSTGIQFFYGTVAFLGVIYVYFFVPETKGKKLSEIEEYFK